MENNIPTLCYANVLSKSAKRALILHILYTHEMHDGQKSLESILFDYARSFNCIVEKEDMIFVHAHGVSDFKEKSNFYITQFLENWKIERLSIITKLILQYAMWELIEEKADVALVVNESIELAKGFAEEDSYRLIHGLIDNAVKKGILDSKL